MDSNNSYWSLVWFAAIAMWGGIVNYRTKVMTGKIPAFSFIYLAGELFVSGFAGVLVWNICVALDLSPYWTAASVGIAGHMGGRLIEMLELQFQAAFDKHFSK